MSLLAYHIGCSISSSSNRMTSKGHSIHPPQLTVFSAQPRCSHRNPHVPLPLAYPCGTRTSPRPTPSSWHTSIHRASRLDPNIALYGTANDKWKRDRKGSVFKTLLAWMRLSICGYPERFWMATFVKMILSVHT